MVPEARNSPNYIRARLHLRHHNIVVVVEVDVDVQSIGQHACVIKRDVAGV